MEKPGGHRDRGKNFTQSEKEIAISTIERFRPLIENNSTDAASVKQKSDTWEKIADEYNSTPAISASRERTAKQLRLLWTTLRRLAKKTVAEKNKKRCLCGHNELDDGDLEVRTKRKIEETGGGQYRPQLAEVDARVSANVEPSEGRSLPNDYDDDDNGCYYEDLSMSSMELTPISPAGPSYTSLKSEVLEDAAPEPIPNPFQMPRKKYLPPRQRTTLELKKILYFKRIKLADMEIEFKKDMYQLELKIKQKELKKLSENNN